MLSGDRRFGGRWALAGRWSRSFERLSADYRELFSLGAMWLKPFSRVQDVAGFGVFAGDPSDEARGRESGAELFYRLQLAQAVSLLPDLQYWSRDDDGVDDVRTWVWGFRVEFQFRAARPQERKRPRAIPSTGSSSKPTPELCATPGWRS